MAPQQPPFVMQKRTDHSAQLYRMMLAGMDASVSPNATHGVGGIHPGFGNQFAVTGTAAMSVNVGTGLVYIPGNSAWQGMYAGWNDSSYPVTVPAADSTQYRKDWIAAVQYDTIYGSSKDQWDIINVPGALASSSGAAQLPSLPSAGTVGAVPIASLLISPGQTNTNVGGTISMNRTWLGTAIPARMTGGPNVNNVVEGFQWVDPSAHELGVVLNGQQRWVTTSKTNGSDWFPPPIVVKQADQSRNNTTVLANDQGLSLPVQQGAKYVFTALIIYNGSSSNNGLAFSFTVPNNCFLRYTAIRQNANGNFAGGFLFNAASIVNCDSVGVGTDLAVTISGILDCVNGNSGTLQLQWAQNNSGGTNTTVRQYSYLALQRSQ